nr:hypothetical protein [Hyphomonas sp. 34-62-18]
MCAQNVRYVRSPIRVSQNANIDIPIMGQRPAISVEAEKRSGGEKTLGVGSLQD